jgi:hypothetical protein
VQEVFDEAMCAVPTPEMPKSLEDSIKAEPMDPTDFPNRFTKRIDRSKFKGFI